VKVTRDRYAALLTETKVRLAAGIQPCRLTNNEPSHLLGHEGASGRKVAGGSSTSAELTTENAWAPELGLEPRTTRLTEGRTTHELAQLAGFTATLRPLLERLGARLLEAANSRAALSREEQLELAAEVLLRLANWPGDLV
jgi:hypothetical protein